MGAIEFTFGEIHDPLSRDLALARSRIANVSRFAQGSEARTASGQPASPLSPVARSWCPLGAVRALPRGSAARHSRVQAAEQLLQAASRQHYGASVAQVCDGTTGLSRSAAHSAALLIIDTAIAAAEMSERSQPRITSQA